MQRSHPSAPTDMTAHGLVICLLMLASMTACGLADEDGKGEIFPHLSPYRLCERAIGESRVSNVILHNQGTQPITVESAELRGDDNCSFKDVQIETTTIDPQGTAFVRFIYEPTVAGEDQAALVVKSDATNFPELIVPLCGAAYDPSSVAAACEDSLQCDAGLRCEGRDAETGATVKCTADEQPESGCACAVTCPACQYEPSPVNTSCGAGD